MEESHDRALKRRARVVCSTVKRLPVEGEDEYQEVCAGRHREHQHGQDRSTGNRRLFCRKVQPINILASTSPCVVAGELVSASPGGAGSVMISATFCFCRFSTSRTTSGRA